jgi:hypothetical protein
LKKRGESPPFYKGGNRGIKENDFKEFVEL